MVKYSGGRGDGDSIGAEWRESYKGYGSGMGDGGDGGGVWVVEVHVIVSGRAVVLGMMNETERNKGRGRGCKNAGGGTRQYPVLLFWYCFSCLHFTL